MHRIIVLLLAVNLTLPHPIPEETESNSTTTTTSSSTTSSPPPSPLALRIIPDSPGESASSSDDSPIIIDGDDHHEAGSHKRHTSTTPSPEELEERRQAFIKSLGGGEDSAPVLVSSLEGLGTLATDLVSLLTSNANETFGPLREARMRARENFPDLGSQLNRYLRNGREYVSRSYRSLVKNLRIKMTNLIRFLLQAVTRLSSTVSGLYSVVISLLDVATRGAQTGARVGTRLLSNGSNFTINALVRGTSALRSLGESGLLVRPFNRFVMVGRNLANGLSEDLFDKVEWTQEGVNAKLELAQALAPNFLIRAHENAAKTTPSTASTDDSAIEIDGGGYQAPSTTPNSEIYVKYNAGDSGVRAGGYAKIDEDEDALALSALAAAASELMMMQRGGREVGNSSTTTTTTTSSDTTKSSSTIKSTTPKFSLLDDDDLPPQGLLNDIFGLEKEINDLKNNLTESGIPMKD